jgi:hypothetical protein
MARSKLSAALGKVVLLLSLVLCLAPLAQADLVLLGVSLDATVRLDGLTILDQGPLDLNPALGIVDISSSVRGFDISATLVALTPDPRDPSVRLQDVTIQCSSTLVGCGALPLVFFGTFTQDTAVPDATAFDRIMGTFSNPAGLSAGASISFQGFVNGVPVDGPFVFTAPAGATSAEFSDADFVPSTLPPGLVLLDGVVNVTLTGQGDTLSLDFAEVGIEPSDTVVPEPTSLMLAGLGSLALLLKRTSYRPFSVLRRKRAPKAE